MATATRDLELTSTGPGALTRIARRWVPQEGMSALPLVALLVGAMGWSFSDARWILGQDGLTAFLIWVALLAALWGYVSASLGLRPWLAQALGCAIGAFVVIEAVGASLPDAQPGLVGWFQATAASVTQAYLDLTWRHQSTTTQAGHFCLVLGIIVWGSAQAAAYDIFGYHRSINGVLLLGVVTIANMALTQTDQFFVLVIFSAAALLLLLLAHAADERESWLHHRIWRGRDFEAPHLQGGVVFASGAIVAALVLTVAASSAPLGGVMSDVGNQVISQLGGLEGLLPGGGNTRLQASADFGATTKISSSFRETSRNVFTTRTLSGTGPTHWRLVSYDTFQSVGWAIGSGPAAGQVAANKPLGAGTLDFVDLAMTGREPVSVSVHVQDSSIKHLIAANEPRTVNTAVNQNLVGTAKSGLNVSSYGSDATDYTVDGYDPNAALDGSGLTEWRLQHAGTGFPKGLLARYTQGTDSLGADSKALLTEIRTYAVANGNAFKSEYDVAKAMQGYLKGSHFTYNTDISALMTRCLGLSSVDCFARIRQGFCEQYATTMTMLMRLDGFPARYVLGYLPGPADKNSPFNQVTNQQKHAWVEVYFPTYGWIPFDPTGGGVGLATTLAPGQAVVATPTPAISQGPVESSAASGATTTQAPTGDAGSTSGDGGGSPLVVVPALLALIVALGLFVPWRRRSRRVEDPDSVYRSVVKLASRLGFKPRPTQTVFEYTDMLADIVPQARESLGIVAVAQVEVTYGARQLSSERLVFLATAHRIVRQSLLGLALRLPALRGRRRRQGSSHGTSGGSGRTRT